MRLEQSTQENFSIIKTSALRNRLAVGALIFLVAFGVRVLSWQDTTVEVRKVQTAVTADYYRVAELLRAGGVRSFLSVASPLADLNNLGHPPGYSILWAGLGTSETAIQFVQITSDSLAAVMIFLIVAELLPLSAGVVAGLLAALSPQFAWNSVLLLPDSISVLPILLAIYLIARAAKNPRILTFVVAGMLVGVSCWLRANALLLTLFIAAAVVLLGKGGKQKLRQNQPITGLSLSLRFALAVVLGTILIILPLTVRNAIVFHRFIPLSLGAGQTLLEGIADYDPEGRLGIPATDVRIMKQESEIYQRPDYYGTLFSPDGVERERARLARGLAVIRAHPFWFAGVMARRASSMVRLERARLISVEPAVSHSLDTIDQIPAAWSKSPAEIFTTGGLQSPQARVSLISNVDSSLAITGDTSSYGEQFAFQTGSLNADVDYVLDLPIKVTTGRIRVSAKSSDGRTYATAIVEALESLAADRQPVNRVVLPFVARQSEPVGIVLSNEASNPPGPSMQIGSIRLFVLGPARFLWTRYPRFVIHGIQKIFLTAVMLPLAIMGLLVLICRKQGRALVILSIVPVYFFLVQSIVHTEYRYVLAVDYFLFAFVGVAVACGIRFVVAKLIGTRSVPSA
ncbi:MAG TPA: glycosyltransferase family 39 protein [Pyrinomonadaceae bacterium]|nr:glycosyltransferase family 39 protein [Pyrinomonadaceae bacterium]